MPSFTYTRTVTYREHTLPGLVEHKTAFQHFVSLPVIITPSCTVSITLLTPPPPPTPPPLLQEQADWQSWSSEGLLWLTVRLFQAPHTHTTTLNVKQLRLKIRQKQGCLLQCIIKTTLAVTKYKDKGINTNKYLQTIMTMHSK